MILKHMPKDALKTFEKTILYSKKKVILTGNRDRRPNNSDDVNARAVEHLTNRIAKLTNVTGNENVYRFPKIFI